jgi:hypothetical protein
MIALICFVLAVLASPFKSKSRLEVLGGFTIITSGLSFRYAYESQTTKTHQLASESASYRKSSSGGIDE